VKNIDESLEAIIECGFTTILTSGQEKNVVEGIVILSELVIKAKNRIVIMPERITCIKYWFIKEK
jgi:copper homeostasis protein